jgi:hypothetical protein
MPAMAEKIFAGIVLAACAAMLLRMVIGWRRRAAFDAFWRRHTLALRIKLLRLWHWRSAQRRARRDAEEAIRRAREGEWDGNVYKPKSFKRPRKLH